MKVKKEQIGLTVGELIDELKHYPTDKIVVFSDSEQYYADYRGIIRVSLEYVKHGKSNIYRDDKEQKEHCVVLHY